MCIGGFLIFFIFIFFLFKFLSDFNDIDFL